MDGLTFIDHLIGHLAWPLAAAGVVVFLSLRHRGAIDALIHRVHKAKAGLFEIELAEAKASADRAQLPPPAVLPPSPSTTRKDQRARQRWGEPPERLLTLLPIALNNPRKAVIDTYEFVSHYALEASQRLDPENRYTDVSPAVIRRMGAKYAEVWDRLREAARRAGDHDEEVTSGQAVDYLLLASRLVGAMKGYVDVVSEHAKGSD